jgi:predicted transcriptional regulator of viral defense system
LVIDELAARQHGVVSRRQLLAAGVGAEAIRHRVEVRRLRTVHRGVYAIGHRLAVEGVFLAAVMACGKGAVLSHRAAAAHQDLMQAAAGPVDVTVPRGGRGRRSGIRVHGTRSLEPDEVQVRRGIPCTTWARTVVDLAGGHSRQQLKRVLEQSQILRAFDLRALQQAMAPGREGSATLRALMDELFDEPPATRSELERRFLELVNEADLPVPIVNGRIGAYEVDFHWPEQKLIVETDGRRAHDTAIAFERDRRRLDLERAGWHVIRLSWRQLNHEPGEIVTVLRPRIASLAWSTPASTSAARRRS